MKKEQLDNLISFYILFSTIDRSKLIFISPEYIREKINKYLGIDINNTESIENDDFLFFYDTYSKTWGDLHKYNINYTIMYILYNFNLNKHMSLYELVEFIQGFIDLNEVKSSEPIKLHSVLEDYIKEYVNFYKRDYIIFIC